MQLIMSNPTEREMIRMRQDAQSDWTTTVNSEVLSGKIGLLAGLVNDGLLTKTEAAKRVNMSEAEFIRRAATIAGR